MRLQVKEATSVSRGTNGPAALPDAVAYQEAVQNPRACFADASLAEGTIAQNRRGLPLAYTGRFAVVFRVVDVKGRAWAARCFTAAPHQQLYDARQMRYEALAQWMENAPVRDLFVPFRYVREGITVGKERFPLLLMGWAEGEPLGRWIETHRNDPASLLNLAATLGEACDRMNAVGIAHGDWQHDNILVSDNGRRVTFVDYDGVFTEGIAHLPPGERGHPNYQHPQRSDTYSGDVDRFPCLLLQTALLAIATEPALYEAFSDGESVVLRESDLRDPDASPAFDALRLLGDLEPELGPCVQALETACQSENVPNPINRTVFERVAARRGLRLDAPDPLAAQTKTKNGASVVLSPGTGGATVGVRTGGASLWSPFDNPAARQTVNTGPVEMSPQIQQWVKSVRNLMRAHKRRERAFLWAFRAAFAFYIYFWNNPPAFSDSSTYATPMAFYFFMVMAFPILVATCYFLWPANLAGLDLVAAAEQNKARLQKLEAARKKARDPLQAINHSPECLSAVAYVASALKRLRFDADGAEAWSNLTPAMVQVLTKQNTRTLGDVGLNTPTPANLGPNGEAIWQHLITRKQERITAARSEYEAVDARRRELMRELERFDRERAGLLSIEGELLEERSRVGNDRFGRFLGRLVAFWT